MSIVGEILEELWNTDLNYKGVRVNIFGIPRFGKYKYESVRNTIWRLEKNGFVEKEISGIILSKYGKEYVKKKFESLKQFNKTEGISEDKKLLVMFDVPTERKGEREWFRWHLKKFGYIMVQQSVWVGPAPLPKEFTAYLKEIRLNNCIKTFKLEKAYR